jgi:CHAD domain-containing protein
VDRGDVKAVHQARVASRRLRELLPVLQLDGEEGHKLGRRLRKLTARLGELRELDVLLHAVDELRQSGRFSDRALGKIADEIGRDAAKVREHLIRRTPSREIAAIARKLDRAANDVELSASADAVRAFRWAIDARIAKRAQALGDAIADAGALYLPDRLHAVRIALKKFRYALELDAETSGRRTTPDLATLKRLQGLLGRMHDLDVLIDRLRQMEASLPPSDGGLRREVDVLVASIENACRRLHARYVRERALLDAIVAKARPPAAVAARRTPVRRAAV